MERIKRKLVLILFGLLTMLGVQTHEVQKSSYEEDENENEHMFI
mgnify:CR=1 FL=1